MPMHMEFVADLVQIAVRPARVADQLGSIVLNLQLNVGPMAVRYATTVWQQLFAVWMQYVAVLAVTVVAARQLLAVAFRRRWVRTWEVVPWKKLY